jgi:hypothetical protein
LADSGLSWVTRLASKERNRLGVVTDHTDTVYSKTCKRSSGPRNTMNIMPVTNRIFLLEKVNNKIPLENGEYFKYLGSMLSMEDVLVKLNPGLLRQRLHLTRLFLLAKWTWKRGRN